MKKRITCITMFDKESLEKIERFLYQLENTKLCKVPYLKEPYALNNREKVDTLPYHFTLSYWDESKEKEALEIFNTLAVQKIELLVEDVKIKQGNENSYNMYFSFIPDEKLQKLQTQIYNKTRNEIFNPKTYTPHISIHSDKDYNKLVKMQSMLIENFKKFKISFDTLGLFEIYPAKRIA